MNSENDDIYYLIAKSLSGELNEQESSQLNSWKSADDQNFAEYNDYKRIWKQSLRLALPSPVNLPKSLAATHKKAGIINRKHFLLPTLVQIAATLIFAIILSVLYNLFLGSNRDPQSKSVVYTQVKVTYGTQTRIELADGSVVHLNSGSTLRFPNSFKGMKTRNVELSGEGHFTVAKNSGQPFIVDIPKMQIKVVGTTFNVDAYPNNSAFTVALIEGSIQLEKKSENGSTNSIEMKPNEVASFQPAEKSTGYKDRRESE